MAFTPIPIHVSVLLRDALGRYLFVEEGGPENLGLWNLPGGHLEKGETIREAGMREALEETHLHVTLTGLVGVYTNFRAPNIHTLRFALYGGYEGEPYPGDDIRSVRWMTLDAFDQLPDAGLVGPALLRRIFTDVRSGQVFPLDVLREPER